MAMGRHLLSGELILQHIAEMEVTLAAWTAQTASLQNHYTPGIGNFNGLIINHCLSHCPWNSETSYYLKYTDHTGLLITEELLENVLAFAACKSAVTITTTTLNAFWNNGNLKFCEKHNVMRYRTGTTFNLKHAYRYSFSPNASCPICPCTDSALHILSGCQHTKMRNMIIERHITACVLIVQALQRDHAEPTKLPTLT